jgi:hypothetical protein
VVETKWFLRGSSEMSISNLPLEILRLIFEYLKKEDLFSASRVCHRWYRTSWMVGSGPVRFKRFHLAQGIAHVTQFFLCDLIRWVGFRASLRDDISLFTRLNHLYRLQLSGNFSAEIFSKLTSVRELTHTCTPIQPVPVTVLHNIATMVCLSFAKYYCRIQ